MPVIWWDAARGNWDSGLIASIFDKFPNTFQQFNIKNPPIFDRAIIIVVGKPEIAPLRKYLSCVDSGVVILTSDEDAYFDYKALDAGHLTFWTQYYNEQYKSDIKERILLGAPTRIKDYKINTHLPKKYLISFVGQVQNAFREQCLNILTGLDCEKFIRVDDAFGGYGSNGMGYQEYLDVLCQSKYTACPSGSMNVDTFRLYESIFCNAVPITNKRSPRDKNDFNYWDVVYPSNKLTLVDNWNELPSVLSKKYEDKNYWWSDYVSTLENKLLDEAKRI